MEGLPLHPELIRLGARLLARTRTAPCYRLFALAGGPPRRPGLVRVGEGGAPIELEVWAVPAAALGGFVAAIPSPLGIGKVVLEDGSLVSGFLCEPHGTAGAEDVTAAGGWRSFLAAAG
jgi:allophanate hydrolase